MEDLHGQHVVVTGATGPLGQAVVETLLACGATVSAVSRRRTALDALRAEMRQLDRLNVAEGDVSDAESVERLFDALERGTGPIDGVVHTVGGFAYGALADTSAETIEALYRALFLSSVLVTRAAIRRMVPRNQGRIVLTGGLASTRPSPNMAVYGALKAAVAHLVPSVSSEVRDTDVTVNAILPGVIDTPENRRNMPNFDHSRWVQPLTIAKAVCTLLGEGGRGIRGALVTIPDKSP
jgi:NAD(P)-dependent dehydrogenase (short-subunit alcohol dehydrogenase family)